MPPTVNKSAPTMTELHHLTSIARMVIGIVEARMGYSPEEGKTAVVPKETRGEDSGVLWHEPRRVGHSDIMITEDFCVEVIVSHQTADLYGGHWKDLHPVLLTVTFNGHGFFLLANETSGTWECADGAGDKRPLCPKLEEFHKEIAARSMESRVTTGQFVEILLDFLTWRETQ